MKILAEKEQKTIKAIQEEFEDISFALDERRKRLWCAAKAKAYNRENGKGGVMLVHKATKISRPRVHLKFAKTSMRQHSIKVSTTDRKNLWHIFTFPLCARHFNSASNLFNS